jgi:peptidylprolyl isomerase
MPYRLLTILLACAAVLVIAACGEREDDAEPGAGTPPPAPAAPTADDISTDLDTKPEIPAPEGDPPAQLQIDDVVEGDGPVAEAGDEVQVRYVGVAWSTGREFDSSWDRGEPLPFQLGTGTVIPGWDQGVAGMRVGGRRQLVIPPDLAYGPQGAGPDIGPNETLIFVVDLLETG